MSHAYNNLLQKFYNWRLPHISSSSNDHLAQVNQRNFITMVQAMVLDAAQTPLREATLPRPKLGEGEILVQVCACAVCRTDLQVTDGESSKLARMLSGSSR